MSRRMQKGNRRAVVGFAAPRVQYPAGKLGGEVAWEVILSESAELAPDYWPTDRTAELSVWDVRICPLWMTAMRLAKDWIDGARKTRSEGVGKG